MRIGKGGTMDRDGYAAAAIKGDDDALIARIQMDQS
jgi:RNA polymerase sigma-70 factor (ECF subfamily)